MTKQQIAEYPIGPREYAWSDISATVVSRTHREVSLLLTRSFRGVNATHTAGPTLTIPAEHYREIDGEGGTL